MVVSFNQPAFIPWAGMFARMHESDMMVILDDTLLARGFTFVNRNRLKGANGEVRVTVPLFRSGRGRQKIRDLEVFEKSRWSIGFLETLRHCYGQSVYFPSLEAGLREVLASGTTSFIEMTKQILHLLRKYLAINIPLVLQSQLGVSGQGIQLLTDIGKAVKADTLLLPYAASRAIPWQKLEQNGMEVDFLVFTPREYPQFFGKFRKNLSVLDMLFCLGPCARQVIERDSFRISGTGLLNEPEHREMM